jgi:FKBP-type peptidyl-prolyl cis-trans isomerase
LDGNFFKTQGLTDISPNALGQGFNDVIKGSTIITAEQADQIVRTELQKNARKKIQPAINEGIKFLAENKKRPGVKETKTGLQYEVITMGTGAKPADTSVVKIHYEGYLLNGTYFDGSRKRGEPLIYPLNKLIPGWVEGVQMMPIGSRFKFYIPYQLGYGEQGSGETIPGGSTLIFDVELLDIVKSN